MASFATVRALRKITLAAMPIERIPYSVDPWSEATNGLSGRLRLEFEDLSPGLRYAIHLELKNHSFDPVAVINQPQVHAELFSSSGKPVLTSGFAIGGPMPIPQWAVIPRDAYICFRIDIQTVDVPMRERGMALIAVGGKTWKIGAGKYVLKTAVAFEKAADGPANQWVGELELPPVEVVLTTQMLAVT